MADETIYTIDYTLSPSTTNVAPDKEEESKEESVLTTYASASPSTSSSTTTLPAPVTGKQRLASCWRTWLSADHLMQDVHPNHATFLLWCFCFMSGLMNSVPFSATMLWCGFQTGNTVQLAIAVGRFLSPNNVVTDFSFRTADQQALVSLLSYLIGGYLARFGDHIGSHKRAWLVLGTFLQALLTMAAALTIWKSGQPSIAEVRGEDLWASALSFLSLSFASASMGLQSVMARRITSHFGATVVLTTLWTELIGDPDLWKPRYVKSRDHRLLAVFAFFLGGMLGRGIINQTSSASLFGIATGFRILIAVFWWFVPAR